MQIIDTPPLWLRPFSIADQIAIDSMDEAARALVERYVRARGEEMADQIADSVVDSLDIRSEVESAVRSALRRHRGGK